MTMAYIQVGVFVKNCPLSIIENKNEDNFMVARLVDSELWYYGLYAKWERAEEVAKELGNGVVLEVETEDQDGQTSN